MPNHITNYVEIKGTPEQLAGLVDKTITQTDEDVAFDFNKLIPMPEELKGTIAPTEVVPTQEEADRKNKEYFGPARPGDDDYRWRYISQAEADRRAEQYGRRESMGRLRPILNWYDWAVEYWGTKWGAYNVSVLKQEPGRLVLQFDTAWSSPEPIFDKLVADGFVVNVMWQDENEGNYGEYGQPWGVFERRVEYDFLG